MVRTYVVVKIGDTPYCIDVAEVSEVVAEAAITRVPGAPRAVGGVINVRGRVMALLDLPAAVDRRPDSDAGSTTALVLDVEGAGDVAAGVDEVVDVVELAEESLQPPPPFGLGGAAAYATAVAELPDGLAVVLGLARLMAMLDEADGALVEDGHAEG